MVRLAGLERADGLRKLSEKAHIKGVNIGQNAFRIFFNKEGRYSICEKNLSGIVRNYRAGVISLESMSISLHDLGILPFHSRPYECAQGSI